MLHRDGCRDGAVSPASRELAARPSQSPVRRSRTRRCARCDLYDQLSAMPFGVVLEARLASRDSRQERPDWVCGRSCEPADRDDPTGSELRPKLREARPDSLCEDDVYVCERNGSGDQREGAGEVAVAELDSREAADGHLAQPEPHVPMSRGGQRVPPAVDAGPGAQSPDLSLLAAAADEARDDGEALAPAHSALNDVPLDATYAVEHAYE